MFCLFDKPFTRNPEQRKEARRGGRIAFIFSRNRAIPAGNQNARLRISLRQPQRFDKTVRACIELNSVAGRIHFILKRAAENDHALQVIRITARLWKAQFRDLLEEVIACCGEKDDEEQQCAERREKYGGGA